MLVSRRIDVKAVGFETAVKLRYLVSCRLHETQMEALWVVKGIAASGADQSQDKPVVIEEHREVPVAVPDRLQAEVLLKERLRSRYVIHGEVKVVDLHGGSIPPRGIAVQSRRRNVIQMSLRMYDCQVGNNPDTCDLLCLDIPKAERVRKELPKSRDLELWAAGAKALGDPTRLAVALALKSAGTACVCDLAWIIGRDERLVSHHARLLKSSGLAISRREGKMAMYELTARGEAMIAAVTSQNLVT
jgi:ArsR family transcriptional regulator, lead/cadmium/zinc/bismuth-responsive transcriptional repressor